METTGGVNCHCFCFTSPCTHAAPAPAMQCRGVGRGGRLVVVAGGGGVFPRLEVVVHIRME